MRLCLLLALILPTLTLAESELDSIWKASVKEMENPDPSLAVAGMKVWIEKAAKAGIRSPEAHFNLALSYWKGQAAGPAVYHILKSASLRSSPLRTAADLGLASEMERSIGIKDGLSRSFSVFTLLFLSPGQTLGFFCAGFWILVGTALFRICGMRRPRGSWIRLGVFFVLLGAASFGYQRYGMHLGVLISEGTVPLFRTPQEATPESGGRLVDLPSGTIISLGREENGFTQISDPVGGWVPSSAVQPLDEPEPG